MKNFSTQAIRTAALAALAVAAFVGASTAQARDDVQFSITFGSPGYVQQSPVYVQAAPVYVQPAPVYSRPAPVYVRPAPVYSVPAPVYVAPAPVYSQRGGAWGDRDRDGVPNYYDRNDYRHPHQGHRDARRGPYGDWDGDGVPNRFDRFPGNPYYR